MSFTYKTLYIPAAQIKPKGTFSTAIGEVNGDELARDVQAALVEMEGAGYKLHTMTPIASGTLYMSSAAYSPTDGVLLVFEKVNAL